MKKITDTKTKIVDPEFAVDSRYSSAAEKKSEAVLLMEKRLTKMKGLSKENILKAKLLQLKLKMENFLVEKTHLQDDGFSKYLELYVDSLYSSRTNFAKDIGIKPITLSQVINKHRDPQEEFILKLTLHSEKVFSKKLAFEKDLWLKVFFQEKYLKTMSSLDANKNILSRTIKYSNAMI